MLDLHSHACDHVIVPLISDQSWVDLLSKVSSEEIDTHLAPHMILDLDSKATSKSFKCISLSASIGVAIMAASLPSSSDSKRARLDYLLSVQGTEQLCLSCWLMNLDPYLDQRPGELYTSKIPPCFYQKMSYVTCSNCGFEQASFMTPMCE